MSEEDIVFRLRKRAEIRAKIDRGEGEVDRISAQLIEAADEIERLRRVIRQIGDDLSEEAFEESLGDA